jgi:hypothetical protein
MLDVECYDMLQRDRILIVLKNDAEHVRAWYNWAPEDVGLSNSAYS